MNKRILSLSALLFLISLSCSTQFPCYNTDKDIKNRNSVAISTLLYYFLTPNEVNSHCPVEVDFLYSNSFGPNSCAYTELNQTFCWGDNSLGQLGIGNNDTIGDNPGEMGNNLTSVNLANNTIPREILIGNKFTCLFSEDRSIHCWGKNDVGQLGIGNNNTIGDEIEEVDNNFTRVDLGTNFVPRAVSLGYEHSCSLSRHRAIKCWGGNGFGQLGIGNTNNIGNEPDEIGNNISSVMTGNFTPQHITSGGYHNCAYSFLGAVCWGRNDYGQLGIGNTNNVGDVSNEMGNNLNRVNFGNKYPIYMCGGLLHTCARLNDTNVYCFGNNDYGQLGIGNNNSIGDSPGEMGTNLTFVRFPSGTRVVDICCGGYHNCALMNNSRGICWGRNSYGQLGIGNDDNIADSDKELGNQLSYILLENETNISSISCGLFHTCILNTENRVKCFGKNSDGELGYGTNTSLGDHPNELRYNLSDLNLGTKDCPEECDDNYYHWIWALGAVGVLMILVCIIICILLFIRRIGYLKRHDKAGKIVLFSHSEA